MPLISLRQLLECGVHFGHPTRKWNPKMKPFIYTKRNGIHILDLQQTSKQIDEVHDVIVKLVSANKTILFVGTKKQAQEAVAEEAEKCKMFYVNKRWLGGMLTNWNTIKKRIDRLNELQRQFEAGEFDDLSKKDRKNLIDEMVKLEKFLGGIKRMERLPDALFVIDVKKEYNAIREARRLNIPIIGILDSNCDPDDVDYRIVGNDDAIRSIKLFCQIVSDSVYLARNGVLPEDSVFIKAKQEQDLGDESFESLSSGAKSTTTSTMTPKEMGLDNLEDIPPSEFDDELEDPKI